MNLCNTIHFSSLSFDLLARLGRQAQSGRAPALPLGPDDPPRQLQVPLGGHGAPHGVRAGHALQPQRRGRRHERQGRQNGKVPNGGRKNVFKLFFSDKDTNNIRI